MDQNTKNIEIKQHNMEASGQRESLEHGLYIAGILAALLLGMAVLTILIFKIRVSAFLVPCLFHAATGYYCPGCGGTRSVISLIRGDILSSFLYYPLVPYGLILYLWFMVSHSIQKISRGKLKTGMHYRNAYLWIALAILFINFFVKNAALFFLHIDLLQLLPLS